jgi:ribonucleoside-diphosphate reductase alpha chain
MLSSLGIKSYITTNKEKNIKFSNGNYTTKTSYDLNITSDRKIFAQTIGFIQKYKMVVLDQICRDEIKSYKRFLDSYKIQQVVSLGKHEVFDITVDDISHAYWTGGILVSNCSEQYLSRESLCVLASVNAGRFSTDKIQFDDEIKKIAYSINRFLDNTNEMELQDSTYATPHQRLAIKALRRTGAGVTNLGEWLLKNNHEYGTKDGNDTIEEFVKKYNYHLYESSISLGHEKGSFELFDRHKFEQSPFIKRMMKLGLEFSAMRNVTCSSIAPTGTLSLMFRGMVASYGIEPSFGLYFWKRTRMNGKYEYYFCVPSVVRKIFEDRGIKLANQDVIKDTWDGSQGLPIAKIIEDNKSIVGIHCRNATDISALDKLDLMAKVMKHCDSSISVTYMLPETSTPTDVYNFILEAHKKEIKSIAAFPDKKLYGIVSSIPFKQLAINLIESHVEIHKQNFSEEELTQLHFATKKIVPTKIQKTVAPPRPKILECDVHHIKVVKKLDKVRTFDYLVIVGLLNNDPYEVFVMENGVLDKKYIKGTLTHLKKGVYSVSFEDGTILNNITENTTEEEDIFTRMTSTSLRHGADIKFVVEQLEKSQGDMWSFGKAMARSLKRYIPDGTLIKAQCPNCGNQLVRHEGCKSCTACDYTACS